MDVHEAVSTGNLFAATYVTAPLDDRFAGMRRLEDMLARLRGQAKEGRGLRD
jgi:hypothetical protein